MNFSDSPSELSTDQLRRRTPGSFLLVPCPRLGRSLRCQGQLEAAAAMVLAHCPLVAEIQEQPLRIWYVWRETPAGPQIRLLDPPSRPRRMGDCCVTYIVPDFLVRMVQGPTRLVEVKPSRRLERPIVRRKQAVARAYAHQMGWGYHVLTEKLLFVGSLLANVRLLARYRRAVVDAGLADRLAACVACATPGSVTLEQFAGTMPEFDPVSLRPVLFHLLAIGRLDCDPVAGPIGAHTPLYPGGKYPWDPFDSAWGQNGCGRGVPFASSVNSPPDGSSSET